MLQKFFVKIIVLLWGSLFVGAPVRPNMLNMPKSAGATIRKPCNSAELMKRYHSTSVTV